jgi:MFS-type transporter involved in bile tolerance (Atg22 family)
MGTTLVGITVSITNSVNIAVGTLGILFVMGFLFLRKSSSLA